MDDLAEVLDLPGIPVRSQFPRFSAFQDAPRCFVEKEEPVQEPVQGGRRRRNGSWGNMRRLKRKLGDSESMDVTEDARMESAFTKEAKGMIEQTVAQLLTQGDCSMLPFSMVKLQKMTRAVVKDEEFAQRLYEEEDRIFNNELLPQFSSQLLDGDADDTIKTFIELYQDWSIKVWNLKLALLLLDNSETFHPPKQPKRKVFPHCMKQFGDALLGGSKDGSEPTTLLDGSQPRTRNALILNFCEWIKDYLGSPTEPPEDVQKFVPFFNAINAVEQQIPIRECLCKSVRDLRDSWDRELQHGGVEYFQRSERVYERMLKLSLLINSKFELLAKEDLTRPVMSLLLTSNSATDRFDDVCSDPAKNANELKFLYEVYSKEGWDLSELSDCYESYVNRTLVKLLRDQMNDSQNKSSPQHPPLVHALISFENSVDNDITYAFKSDKKFKAKAEMAFEMTLSDVLGSSDFIRDTLLRYLDYVMRKSKHDTVVRSVGDATQILSIVSSCRDSFFDRYAKSLSKRLLLTNIGSTLDNEKVALVKFSEVFGTDRVDPIRVRLDDMDSSQKFVDEFKASHQIPLDVSFCCVNGEHFGDPPKSRHVRLPESMAAIADQFEKSHKAKKAPIFDWKYYFHRVTIDVAFTESNIQSINASIYQAAILLAFEDADMLTFDQLQQSTELEPSFLTANLNALTSKKHPVMLADGTGTFRINDGFTSSKDTVRIPMNVVENDESSKDLIHRTGHEKDNEELLRMRLKAFVTRTLKTDGPKEHLILVEAIMEFLGIPSLTRSLQTTIKVVIEGLIGEGYIAREGEGYTYIP